MSLKFTDSIYPTYYTKFIMEKQNQLELIPFK
jgi:hypothetical protein